MTVGLKIDAPVSDLDREAMTRAIAWLRTIGSDHDRRCIEDALKESFELAGWRAAHLLQERHLRLKAWMPSPSQYRIPEERVAGLMAPPGIDGERRAAMMATALIAAGFSICETDPAVLDRITTASPPSLP
jgi:hypothetical protein